MAEYDKETFDKLIPICYEIIDNEALPIVDKIIFKNSFVGTKCKRGICTYKYINGNIKYTKILIHLVKVIWVLDSNGNYTDRNNGEKYKKLDFGKLRNFNGILKTLAHEIAHLKYLNHTLNHKNYTEHILNILIKKIEENNIIGY